MSTWKESIAAELHVLQKKCQCWEIITIITSSGVGEGEGWMCGPVQVWLVVNGSKQVSGIDYTNNFAPVVNIPL